jgi:hypothetical protein
MRKVEATPLPRLLTIYLGVAVWATLIFINWYYVKESSKVEAHLKKIKAEESKLKQEEAKLDALIAEIEQSKVYVETAETLYRKRTIWSKVLADLKQIMNDQGYNKTNENREYVWFKSLTLEHKAAARVNPFMAAKSGPPKPTEFVKLDGYASARGTRKATKMVQDLVASMVAYKPKELPEIEALDKLEKELKARQKKIKEMQEKNKGKKVVLSEKQQREIRAAEELKKHLQERKSGGIATLPFFGLFDKASRTVETKWKENASSSSGGKSDANMPQGAMEFVIKVGFKPKEKPAAKPMF